MSANGLPGRESSRCAARPSPLRHLWPLNGAKSALVLGIIAFAAIAWAVGLRGVQRSRPEANSVAALDAGHLRIFTLATLILAVAGFLLAFLFPG